MSEPTVRDKFDVMIEDITSAANIAGELHQNWLASTLYMQVAMLLFSKEDIDAALAFQKEMAEACVRISRKYIKEPF